jgi:RNA polymerase sigma-70 factor (ECF subfamily)
MFFKHPLEWSTKMSSTVFQIKPNIITDEQIKSIGLLDKRRAIKLLTLKYREALYRKAFYIVRNKDEAFDIVQEAFVKVLRQDNFFDVDFKIKAWLYRVVTNRALNIRRDTARRKVLIEQNVFEDRTVADQVTSIVEREEGTKLQQCLSKLSEDHRKVIELRYFDELSYKEISEVLDVAPGTVMSRISRAKIALHSLMSAD